MAAITDDVNNAHEYSQNIHEHCVCAIDFEATGALRNDIPFAVGVAFAPINAENYDDIQRYHVCLNLHKPEDMSWEEFWVKQGWERRCWNQFWVNNVDMLNMLQDPNRVHLVETEQEFAAHFNNFLTEFELSCKQSFIVTDTTMFDTCLAYKLLTEAGFRNLNYTREGKYRWGYELDSFLTGIAWLSPCCNWKDFVEFKNKYVKPLKIADVPHDHHPENDAASILIEYLAGIKLLKKLQEKGVKSFSDNFERILFEESE